MCKQTCHRQTNRPWALEISINDLKLYLFMFLISGRCRVLTEGVQCLTYWCRLNWNYWSIWLEVLFASNKEWHKREETREMWERSTGRSLKLFDLCLGIILTLFLILKNVKKKVRFLYIIHVSWTMTGFLWNLQHLWWNMSNRRGEGSKNVFNSTKASYIQCSIWFPEAG